MTNEELKEKTIVLASGSARRKEIFEAHGFIPVIRPMDVDETLPKDIRPEDAVMYLALKKGLACETAMQGNGSKREDAVPENGSEREDASDTDTDNALIVSADTIVYAKDITTGNWCIMGKPKDKDDAWRMLSSIRGTSHKVMTGVAVICPSAGIRRVFCDTTDVFVDNVSDADLQAYIDSGEPYGKAGGYAIQLGFGKYIDHIEGDYENVVGFPYEHFVKEMQVTG